MCILHGARLFEPADMGAHIDDDKRRYISCWLGVVDTTEILAILGADNSVICS